MRLPNFIQSILDRVQEYFETEKELLRLKIVRQVSFLLAHLIAMLFVVILFNIMLAMAGIWLGFYFTELLGSHSIGFGLSAGIFVLLLVLVMAFRRTLLVKPFVNIAVKIFASESKDAHEDEKSP